MKVILRMLSKDGCVSYDDLVEAGVPRDVVHIYAIRLERDGIARRLIALDKIRLLCLQQEVEELKKEGLLH